VEYINIASINQKLIFKNILVYMNPLNGVLESKVEKRNGDKTTTFFKAIPNKKHVTQMLDYPGSAIGFIQTHFY